MTEDNITLRRAGASPPSSWKPESRTFEATLATGAAVPLQSNPAKAAEDKSAPAAGKAN